MSAYWLGVRDAASGHAESHPVRPFTSAELADYRQGYSDQRVTMATSSRGHSPEEIYELRQDRDVMSRMQRG